MRKYTREQAEKQEHNSHYSRKRKARIALARQLGLDTFTPFPCFPLPHTRSSNAAPKQW